MEKELVFRVVMVDKQHGAGEEAAASAQKEVHYTGDEVSAVIN